MESINEVWADFELNEGVIDNNNFKQIMVKVAKHQGLYEGDAQEVKTNTIFFTPDNLQNIFEQIQDHEMNEN